MSAPFVKHDAGKLRFDLIDPAFEAELADVLTIGAAVYGDENWKNADPAEARLRYYAAHRRHMNKWFAGQEIDPDSGKPHLLCATCCLMFARWFERKAGASAIPKPIAVTDNWKVPVNYEP